MYRDRRKQSFHSGKSYHHSHQPSYNPSHYQERVFRAEMFDDSFDSRRYQRNPEDHTPIISEKSSDQSECKQDSGQKQYHPGYHQRSAVESFVRSSHSFRQASSGFKEAGEERVEKRIGVWAENQRYLSKMMQDDNVSKIEEAIRKTV